MTCINYLFVDKFISNRDCFFPWCILLLFLRVSRGTLISWNRFSSLCILIVQTLDISIVSSKNDFKSLSLFILAVRVILVVTSLISIFSDFLSNLKERLGQFKLRLSFLHSNLIET